MSSSTHSNVKQNTSSNVMTSTKETLLPQEQKSASNTSHCSQSFVPTNDYYMHRDEFQTRLQYPRPRVSGMQQESHEVGTFQPLGQHLPSAYHVYRGISSPQHNQRFQPLNRHHQLPYGYQGDQRIYQQLPLYNMSPRSQGPFMHHQQYPSPYFIRAMNTGHNYNDCMRLIPYHDFSHSVSGPVPPNLRQVAHQTSFMQLPPSQSYAAEETYRLPSQTFRPFECSPYNEFTHHTDGLIWDMSTLSVSPGSREQQQYEESILHPTVAHGLLQAGSIPSSYGNPYPPVQRSGVGYRSTYSNRQPRMNHSVASYPNDSMLSHSDQSFTAPKIPVAGASDFQLAATQRNYERCSYPRHQVSKSDVRTQLPEKANDGNVETSLIKGVTGDASITVKDKGQLHVHVGNKDEMRDNPRNPQQIAPSTNIFNISGDYHVVDRHEDFRGSAVDTVNKGRIRNDNIDCKTIISTAPHIMDGHIDSHGDTNHLEAIMKAIHDSAWQKSHFNINEVSAADQINEPDFEVYPQMVESKHYYRGGHHKEAADESNPGAKKKVFKQPQYTKERRFEFGSEQESTAISDESLMEKIHSKQERLGVLGLVAQAGAGKTTCMRRWARRTMIKSKIYPESGFISSDQSRFKLVHFINLKSVKQAEEMSLPHFLFGELFADYKSMEIIYKWMLEHQNEVVIFFDGFDQAPWTIEEENIEYLNPFAISSTATIFFNVLSRHLLPGVRVVLSSREYKVTSLPQEAWLKDVVSLVGFSHCDAKKLFDAVTAETSAAEGSKGVSNWDQMARKSAAILPFLSIPAFLMFAAIVYNFFGSPPTCATDLMAKVLETLQVSPIVKERRRIWDIINKLKELSQRGMKNGLVIFSTSDLKRCGLLMEDVRDLLLMVPRSRSLTHHLVEGDNVFFFCHQSMQEFLSACAIVQMEYKGFKEFVATHLHEDRWSVVRRFVCGLIFAVTTNSHLLEVSDSSKKQRYLRRSLASQLQSADKYQLLELLAAIYESNDFGLISSNLNSIQVERTPLGRDSAHLISSLIARRKKIDYLSLELSQVDDDLLELMAENMENCKVEINLLNLQHNRFTTSGLNAFLENIDAAEIVIHHEKSLVEPDCLDWKNIRRMKVLQHAIDEKVLFVFISHPDSIHLEIDVSEAHQYFSGFHSTKDNSLNITVDASQHCKMIDYAIRAVDVASDYFDPIGVSIAVTGNTCRQYLHYYHLISSKGWSVSREVDEVVVEFSEYESLEHCKEKEISSFVHQFKVKILNFAIGIKQFRQIPSTLRDIVPRDCEIRVNVCVRIGTESNFQSLLQLLEINQVEYLRVEFHYDASQDDLLSLINISNVKKQLSIINFRGCVKLLESKENYIRETAEPLEIPLQFISSEALQNDDAWSWVSYISP